MLFFWGVRAAVRQSEGGGAGLAGAMELRSRVLLWKLVLLQSESGCAGRPGGVSRARVQGNSSFRQTLLSEPS